MRGAPQVGFSATIRKIKSRTSLLTRFRPPTWLILETHLQYKRNPARCQFTTVLGVSMPSPTGQSSSAKLDGTDAPYKGDPGTTSVSVKKLNKNAIEETDKRDGKVISIARISVDPDSKTMTIA